MLQGKGVSEGIAFGYVKIIKMLTFSKCQPLKQEIRLSERIENVKVAYQLQPLRKLESWMKLPQSRQSRASSLL